MTANRWLFSPNKTDMLFIKHVYLCDSFLQLNFVLKITKYIFNYGIAIYRNILYLTPCIVIQIISPGSCQYTSLLLTEFMLSYAKLFQTTFHYSGLIYRFATNKPI